MEKEKGNRLISKFSIFCGKYDDLDNYEHCEAWLELEKEVIEYRVNASPEERAYFDKYMDLEGLHMICSGIRYMREQDNNVT